MTFEQRVAAVSGFGFTPRQARFLVTVMLHSGVCVGRQYCAFAGIAYGEPMRALFLKLERGGFATATTCAHGRARLFHIHHKPLYEAIGEPNNRFRRPTSLARAVERLMVLDAVTLDRAVTWLGTERDKVSYFTTQSGVGIHDLPSLTFRSADAETVRHFPDKLPVGVAQDGGSHVFLYVVTEALPMTFRIFLERHAELLRSLHAWTVRVVVPRHLAKATPAYEEAFREQLLRPLPPHVVDELRWYFHACRAGADDADERFCRARTAFGAPRFRALYKRWLDDGDHVLDAVVSPVLSDTVGLGKGALQCQVLPHAYLHLLSLVGKA
jgi:hypothetical protein